MNFIKLFLASTVPTMSKEDLVVVIMSIPDEHLEAIAEAILERRKEGNVQQGAEANDEEVVDDVMGTGVEKVIETVTEKEVEGEVQHGPEEDVDKEGDEEVAVTPNKVVLRIRPSKRVGNVRRQKKNVARGPIRRDNPKKRRCRSFPTINQAH